MSTLARIAESAGALSTPPTIEDLLAGVAIGGAVGAAVSVLLVAVVRSVSGLSRALRRPNVVVPTEEARLLLAEAARRSAEKNAAELARRSR